MPIRIVLLSLLCAYAAHLHAAANLETSQGPTALEGRRADERRVAQPITVDVFGSRAELGARYEVDATRRRNFALDTSGTRDRELLDHELKLDLHLPVGERVTMFAQLIGNINARRNLHDGSEQSRNTLSRGQTWLLIDQIGGLPLTVQAGRIALIERRSWWWDTDLDAVRANYVGEGWHVQTGVARDLAPVAINTSHIDPAAKDVTRWFGDGSVRWARRQLLEAFWLVANDRSGAPARGAAVAARNADTSDARLRWFGLRASGESKKLLGNRLSYCADAAMVRGREIRTALDQTADGSFVAGTSRNRRVRGHAWDLGVQWQLPGSLRPTVSLDWASGSGGPRNNNVDDNFQQTGLQENKARVAGVRRLRYYGELLDPDLSNLQVATLGLGARLLANSSVELQWHHYRQETASNRLQSGRLSMDPLGRNPEIGREVDLFVAMCEWQHVELTMKVARFLPGAAFAPDHRHAAHSLEFGATVNF